MSPLVTLSSSRVGDQHLHDLTFKGKLLFQIFQFPDEDTGRTRFAICQEKGMAAVILSEETFWKEYDLLGDAVGVCTKGLNNWITEIIQEDGEENQRCAA